MQTSFSSATKLSEEHLYQYLLVVHPDSDVYEKIETEKQDFYNEYKEKIAIKTKPHITVANFLAKESMEETIIRWIQRICNQKERFTVTLNNYSGFPPHTIYLRVQNEKPFQQIAKELKVINSYVSSCSCPHMKLISKPHVSIAKRLSEEVYFKALIQYAHKSFHASFIVNELVLLRRENQFDEGKPINIFGLPPGNTLLN
jgi:2'-5' RNA ligase